jgi:hypothetical protein
MLQDKKNIFICFLLHFNTNRFYEQSIIEVCKYSMTKQIYITYRQNFNLLKPTGHVMHQQFNIQQLYALLTLYLCVLYLSENKQRLVPLTA